MSIKHLPPWGISVALLVAAAAFFLFCMRGYTYIGCSLLFIAALVLIHHFGSEGFRRWTLILVSLGLIYFCLVELPIVKNARTEAEPGRKYLIVLGAAVHGDSPSLALTHRLEGALDYLNRYPDSVAIVSGGKGKGENMTEAECMRRWLINHEVDSGRIICEDKAILCREKLDNLLKRLDDKLFVRCHCSFIVNLHHVREYRRTQLLLSNGDVIPCSRSNQKSIREALTGINTVTI